MKTEIISNTYENGKRVETQRVTYDKSDDLYTLANLQRRYEGVCKQIENAGEDENVETLLSEKTKLEAEIVAQETKVDGYDEK